MREKDLRRDRERGPSPNARSRLGALALFFLSGALARAAVVRSSDLALTVDARKGDLLSLRRDGEDLLAEKALPMFRLAFRDQGLRLDSRSAREIELETIKDGVRIQYGDFPGAAGKLGAVVQVSARPALPGIALSIQVGNETRLTLEEIEFPVIEMPLVLGENHEDDRLFFPGGDGVLVGAGGLARRKRMSRDYPGHCSMQFMAYFDDRCGLSLQCRDADGECKRFRYEVDGQKLKLRLIQLRPCLPGRGFSGAPVVLYACEKSWMHAAGHYRRWALEQEWARRPPEAPRWLDDAPFLTHGEMRPLGMGKYLVPLDEWGAVARAWKKFLGARRVCVEFRRWEHGGTYTSPYYFPLHPSRRAVASTMKQLHRGGHNTMAMVAGLKWMISREEFKTPHYWVLGYDATEKFEKEGKPVCVVDRNGKVHVKEPWSTWDGRKSVFCPGTDFARKHFLRTSRELARAGFDLFEFDQMNGGNCPDCYSLRHDHPPGPGRWKMEAIRGLIRLTRETGRKRNKNFATAIEDPSELLLPVLDVYFGRQNNVDSWPAIGDGSEIVPAFSYVYHTVCPGATLDNRLGTRPEPYALIRLARAFVWGRFLGGHFYEWQLLRDCGEDDLLPLPEKLEADQSRLLLATAKTHAGPGFDYLVKGRMLRAEKLRVPRFGFPVVEWKEGKKHERRLTQPAVLHSAWERNGRRAFFFVNVTKEEVLFPYGFQAEDFQPKGSSKARLYLNGGRGEWATLERLGKLKVPGLSVLMVEFR